MSFNTTPIHDLKPNFELIVHIGLPGSFGELLMSHSLGVPHTFRGENHVFLANSRKLRNF